MKLSLGPNLFYWSKQTLEDFYQQAIQSEVDIIYLGEVVCSKRNELRTGEWIDLAKSLSGQGKQIVISTLALLEARSELSALKKFCENGELAVEANDMGAVQLMCEQGLPFYAGPSINVYNGRSLELLAKQGMQRWVMPVELNRNNLRDMLSYAEQQGFRDQFEAEVFSYGKLPLAYSARCFTARAHNSSKDDCQRVCINYPDGLSLTTQEDQQLFTVNGIQTLSGHSYNLINEIPLMKELGVDVIRISPQSENLFEVITDFRQGIDGISSKQALIGSDQCNGYWYGEPGMVSVA
jgi:collagenase-like PrtC family protease